MGKAVADGAYYYKKVLVYTPEFDLGQGLGTDISGGRRQDLDQCTQRQDTLVSLCLLH